MSEEKRARLEGKVIVVSGSTRGIGKHIAKMCAAEGANVVISGRNAEEGRQVERSIEAAYGIETLFIKGDLRFESVCRQLIEKTVSHFGKIDGLINNAGVFPRASIVEADEEHFDWTFDVNIKAPFFLSKYAIRFMMENGGGSIVHMGSTHGYKGAADLSAYACSKGALLTLSRHIAAHYAKYQIRSNWVTVGWVASEGEIALHASMGTSKAELQRTASEIIPSGRMQTGEDLGHGVIYLLSDEASQVTGSELAIAGALNL